MSWNGYIRADARHLPIVDASVRCVVTSPPYWGLRDYGSANQIGLEPTPEDYVVSLLEVFQEVWRVLKDDGTAWLNLGDSYAGSGKARGNGGNGINSTKQRTNAGSYFESSCEMLPMGLKPKDLVGIPWRVAFALQADGWYLRSDIIWAKRNCMPESVTDRPTRSHEYIFLLSKSERYYYDAAAIAERSSYPTGPNSPQSIASPYGQGFTRKTWAQRKALGEPMRHGLDGAAAVGSGGYGSGETRNKRTVWRIASQPYPEAHYATFPEEIPETCILAGSRPGDLILDPFAGSGTTARVAERLGRRWLSCDLAYQDLQEKRLRNVQRELYR